MAESMQEVVAIAAARTPFSKYGGALKDVSSVDLAVHVVKEVLHRAGLTPQQVDELYLGQTVHAEMANYLNVTARQVVLKAGLPPSTISLTVDRACCSSMTAVQMGYKAIRYGDARVVIAAGTENMSRTPLLAPYTIRWGSKLGNVVLEDCLFELGYKGWAPVSVDAGEVALEHGIGRHEQDCWALQTQQRYARALAAGKMAEEIAPIPIPGNKGEMVLFERDESPRPDTTLEALGKLKTIYGSPTVTPGNAPGLEAGASAILLMSGDYARELGLTPLGKIVTIGTAAQEPRYIATVPALAIKNVLNKAGVSLDEIKLIEINEAFAAMPLVSTHVLAEGDLDKIEELRAKTNVNGGAVAIGHPVGASGARLVLTMLFELRRLGGGMGVAAICGGLAQGDSVLVRV